jgi:hypothetical protein
MVVHAIDRSAESVGEVSETAVGEDRLDQQQLRRGSKPIRSPAVSPGRRPDNTLRFMVAPQRCRPCRSGGVSGGSRLVGARDQGAEPIEVWGR